MKHASVLIVEDDYSFALDLEMKLEKLGFDIVGNVHNMEDTLQMIQERKVDIILLDLNLHDTFSGVDAGTKITSPAHSGPGFAFCKISGVV